MNIFLSLLILFANAANAADFIRLKNVGGRPLFHSQKFGAFWSIGMVTFMDDGDSIPMRTYFKKNYSKVLYEKEFARLKEHGFNTLGGWSNLEYNDGRLPWGKVLFDDKDHPLKWPLKNFKGETPPLVDSALPCPIGDPYDPDYLQALDIYLAKYVSPHREDPNLLIYWLGAEFGFGDTNAIDFGQYVYSKEVQRELAHWLEQRHKKITVLNQQWKTSFKDWTSAAASAVHDPRDLSDFSVKLLGDWIRVVVSGVKKYDPNHLISSPKISFWDYPPFLSRAFELRHFESWKGHFDVIAIDWYSREPVQKKQGWDDLRRLHKELGIPVMNSEFGVRQKMQGWTNINGARTLVETQQERADNLKGQMLAMFADPMFVGAHWFRWQDHITKTQQMNKGFMKTDGSELALYLDLARAFKEVNAQIADEVQRLK